MRMDERGDHWIAAYTLDFNNENNQGETIEGKADMEMWVRSDGNRLWITSQKSRVHDLKSGSTAANKQAGPPPVKIRLPGPVWVAVNTHQVNGRTYEIHEAFGLVANHTVIHRTYRNLVNDKTPSALKARHPDGVISMQTAEMEGALQSNGPLNSPPTLADKAGCRTKMRARASGPRILRRMQRKWLEDQSPAR
ncbi:MAG: hypothetical protein R3F13_18720 [Prosthecobacter sp.]